MLKQIITFITVLIMWINFCDACYSPPKTVYKIPTFVDFDYVSPEYYDSSYGTMDRFNILISQYPNYALALKKLQGDGDKTYRDIEKEKAQYIKIANGILASKGVSENIIDTIHKEEIDYFYYSTVCHSNNSDAAVAFLKAVATDPNVKSGYLELAKIRLQIFELCKEETLKSSGEILEKINQLKSNADLAGYQLYLEALVKFYTNDNEAALRFFKQILAQHKTDGWLKETVTYLIGRVQIMQSQKTWDGYSEPQYVVDKESLRQARKSFDTYVKMYPKGIYIRSAIGVKRRLAYLEGNRQELDRLIKEGINHALANPFEVSVPNVDWAEFRTFFKGDMDIEQDHPLLTTYFILKKSDLPSDALRKLESVKPKFEEFLGLYNFLYASILYRNKQYAELIERIPEEEFDTKPTSISVAVMRARSLANLGRKQEALNAWKKINSVFQDDIVQVELASIYANEQDFEELLKDPVITNIRLKQDLIQFATTNPDLETLLTKKLSKTSRAIVEQELFKRYLLAGQFKDMSKLYTKAKSPQIYIGIKEAVDQLAKNPNDADSRLKVGIFMYSNFITFNSMAAVGRNDWIYDGVPGLAELKPYCVVCNAVNLDIVPNNYLAPYDHFLVAEREYSKFGTQTDNEAKTLFYMTKCFRYGEYQSRCQWQKDYKNESQKWFNRVHKLYPESDWAKMTKYYY
jgi:tetratricopeptide (TPR) repeat protein